MIRNEFLKKLSGTVVSMFIFNPSAMSDLKNNSEIVVKVLKDDGTFPNNKLPLILYRQAIEISGADPAAAVEKVFHENKWGNSWRNGIYPYHHYHSTAHEVLGIYAGKATVQLGGPEGITVELTAGDVVVIPAGVAHKRLDSDSKFACVGAYPPGQEWDMNYGKAGERPETDKNIAKVELPPTDPVSGKQGKLIETWKA